MHSISRELQDHGHETDWVQVFGNLARRFDGAYNIVLLTAHGELIVARDPLGLRPLCIAENGPLFAAASESIPLSNLGFREVRSLEPGTMVIAHPKDGVRIERFAEPRKPAHCFFEWIYFANVASTLDDRSVYLSRAALGKELARLEDVPTDVGTIVVPVPDTAKAAADAMAFELGLPSVEGLMRNRYVGRTFIEGTADREQKVRLKYTPLPEVLSGKRVLLVEDSIVRSTTMRALCARSANVVARVRSICGWPVRRSSRLAITESICPPAGNWLLLSTPICPMVVFPKRPSNDWPRSSEPIVSATCLLTPWPAPSIWRATAFAAPVLPANILLLPVSTFTRSTLRGMSATPTAQAECGRTSELFD